MDNDRRYQLQSEAANRGIDALLEHLRVPSQTWRYYAEMLTSILKMFEDGADLGDLKIANTALKELRYGFKVFAPYRDVPKVTVFGSARTPPEDPISCQAQAFARRMAEAGWMVITGAGDGVMAAAQHGAGREQSFGLNIRIPWEQEANPVIADDAKLINFKYFFIRKLFFLKEAAAVCLFPGGFGTSDEAFEVFTLIQTGKTIVMPVVLVDVPGGQFWKTWEGFIVHEMVERGLVSPDDVQLFRLADDPEVAASEILDFYRVFHSQRVVGDDLVLRLRRPLSAETLSALEATFGDLLQGQAEQIHGPLAQEGGELPDLVRLRLPVVRTNYGRLRLLIDAINRT
ncbi:MAG: LOG family protein [Candidatus Methylomirabilia bacterium]